MKDEGTKPRTRIISVLSPRPQHSIRFVFHFRSLRWNLLCIGGVYARVRVRICILRVWRMPGYANSHLYFDICLVLVEFLFSLSFLGLSLGFFFVFCCPSRSLRPLRSIRLMLPCDAHFRLFSFAMHSTRCARATANFRLLSSPSSHSLPRLEMVCSSLRHKFCP